MVPFHRRSLPGGIASTGAPPADTSETDTFNMAKKQASKPVLLPVLIPVAIALGLYLVIFHVLLPTWRAHRERYRQYLPLHTTSTLTSRLPHFLQPTIISSTLSSLALRIFFPTTWAIRRAQQHQQRTTTTSSSTTYRASNDPDSSDTDDALFSAESGEAMVGFDVPNANSDPRDLNRRRRENMERFAGRNMAYARDMGFGGADDDTNTTTTPGLVSADARRGRDEVHPERRLNRELEAGFRDDSDDDEEDDERGVTYGRRSFSASR